MRVLVLGSAGMAGHIIAHHLHRRGYRVTGFQRAKSDFPTPFNVLEGDALDHAKLRSLLTRGSFDVLINCVGILNTQADVDPSLTVRINSLLPQSLEGICEALSIQLIHISTDCVFSGKSGGYAEDDWTDTTDLYGVSKAAGEVGRSALTLRTSIVGPELKSTGTGLLNWFLTAPSPVNGFSQTMWGGVTTLTLAKFVDWAIANNAEPGLVHVSNGLPISKLELLQLFAREFRPNVEIRSVPGPQLDKSLMATSRRNAPKAPSYAVMVSELSHWMRSRASLYPNVKNSR